MKKLFPTMVLLPLIFSITDAVQVRSYHLGNSLTDQFVNGGVYQTFVSTRGNAYTRGSQRIPGTPLSYLYQNSESGFTEAPFGNYYNALTNYEWDYLVMQMFQWDAPTETQAGDQFMSFVSRKSPLCKGIVYQTWPLKTQTKTFEQQWLGGIENINASRAYFKHIIDSLRSKYGNDRVILAPCGEVMYELYARIKSGAVTSIQSIDNLYSDDVHLNHIGNYLIACVFYSLMYKDDPLGLPWDVNNTSGLMTAAKAKDIQECVKTVIIRESAYTGIQSFGPYSVSDIKLFPTKLELASAGTYTLSVNIIPGNASNKTVLFASGNQAVASVSSSGKITANIAGSTTITATSQDGNKTAICTLNVVTGQIAVAGIIIPTDSITLLRGATQSLTSVVLPSAATNKNVSWRTLDSTFATVSSTGVVTGRQKGRVAVIATTINGGLSDTCYVKVTVPNTAPVPNMYFDPLVAYVNESVNFSGKGSKDNDPDDYVLGYDWDFGDGSPINFSMTPTHSYTNPGSYTVKLRVLDLNDTRSNWISKNLTIKQKVNPALLVYDGFEGVSDTILGGHQGGFGWLEPWSKDNKNYKPNNSSLTYQALATTGTSARVIAISDIGRPFNLTENGPLKDVQTQGSGWMNFYLGKTNTTLYMSGMIQREASNTTSHPLCVTLHDEKVASWVHGKNISIGYFGSNSNFNGKKWLSLRLDTTVTRSSVEFVPGNTYFFVLKITWGTTTTQADLYVNISPIATSLPTPVATVNTSSLLLFKSIALQSGSWSEQGTVSGNYDEIRIGTTLASVMPTESTANKSLAVSERIQHSKTISEYFNLNGRKMKKGQMSSKLFGCAIIGKTTDNKIRKIFSNK